MNPTAAAGAYANAARLGGDIAGGAKQASPAGDGSAFSDMVMKAVDGVAETGQAAEIQAADMAAGKTEIVDLVTAVAETEVAMETLVTVRDRVISAYQDILNMPI